MEWHCAQADCPLHPIYIEQERIVEEKRIQKEIEIREKEQEKWLVGQMPFGHATEGELMFDSKTGEVKAMMSGTFMPVTGLGNAIHDHSYNTHTHNMMGSITDNSSWLSPSASTIETDNTPYPVPFECLMCKHMDKPDMRDIIIVSKAKKALEED